MDARFVRLSAPHLRVGRPPLAHDPNREVAVSLAGKRGERGSQQTRAIACTDDYRKELAAARHAVPLRSHRWYMIPHADVTF
jgi:hypothetical protein